MASGRVNLAVIVGSAATLAASWAGIVAADSSSADAAESAQPAVPVRLGGASAIILPPLPVAPIAPLLIPDAPSTDLSSLTRVEVKPLTAPRITLPSTANLVPAPSSSATKVVRKSKAS